MTRTLGPGAQRQLARDRTKAALVLKTHGPIVQPEPPRQDRRRAERKALEAAEKAARNEALGIKPSRRSPAPRTARKGEGAPARSPKKGTVDRRVIWREEKGRIERWQHATKGARFRTVPQ